MGDQHASPTIASGPTGGLRPGLIITKQPFAFCPFLVDKTLTGDRRFDRHLVSIVVKVVGIASQRGHVRCLLFTNDPVPRRHVNKILFQRKVCDQVELELDERLQARIVMAVVIMGSSRAPTATCSEFADADMKPTLDVTAGQDQMRQTPMQNGDLNHEERGSAHAVRIGFQAFLHGHDITCTEVVLSDPVYDTEDPTNQRFAVARADKQEGPACGGQELWILPSHDLPSDQVEAVFFEPLTGWQATADVSNDHLPNRSLLIVTTPQYGGPRIEAPTTVNVALRQKTDQRLCPTCTYTYLPSATSMTKPNGTCFLSTSTSSSELSLNELKLASDAVQPSVSAPPTAIPLADQVKALWEFAATGEVHSFVTMMQNTLSWTDKYENTVLHIAVRNKQSFALMTLLKALEKHPDAKAILNHENFRKQTALQLAVRFDDPDCVHYLVTAGADRNVQDINGCNVAHHLCDSFNEDVYRDVLFPPEGSPAAKTSLDLSVKNILGYSPLALAVKRKKLVLVDSLIEARADVNQVTDGAGMHPLHLCVEAGDMDILDLLLKTCKNAGSSVDVQTRDGTTPLQLAVILDNQAAALRLLHAGADPKLKTSSRPKATHSAEIPAPEVNGHDDLKSAIDFAQGNELTVEILQGKRVDVCDDEKVPSTTMTEPESGCSPNAVASIDVQLAAVASTSYPSASPLPDVDAAQVKNDDVSSLDYLTRFRLSRMLDKDDAWKQFATHLECQHMVEFLEACSGADQSSPTMLFLDQYEQMPQAAVSSMVLALRHMAKHDAASLLQNASE